MYQYVRLSSAVFPCLFFFIQKRSSFFNCCRSWWCCNFFTGDFFFVPRAVPRLTGEELPELPRVRPDPVQGYVRGVFGGVHSRGHQRDGDAQPQPSRRAADRLRRRLQRQVGHHADELHHRLHQVGTGSDDIVTLPALMIKFDFYFL